MLPSDLKTKIQLHCWKIVSINTVFHLHMPNYIDKNAEKWIESIGQTAKDSIIDKMPKWLSDKRKEEVRQYAYKISKEIADELIRSILVYDANGNVVQKYPRK